jgi:hypothetical protein
MVSLTGSLEEMFWLPIRVQAVAAKMSGFGDFPGALRLANLGGGLVISLTVN